MGETLERQVAAELETPGGWRRAVSAIKEAAGNMEAFERRAKRYGQETRMPSEWSIEKWREVAFEAGACYGALLMIRYAGALLRERAKAHHEEYSPN